MLVDDLRVESFVFTGLGEAVGVRVLVGELGDETRKLARVLLVVRGCSSSLSDASPAFRLRRFAGGAISAVAALVELAFHTDSILLEAPLQRVCELGVKIELQIASLVARGVR